MNLSSRAFTGKYNKTKDAGIYSCVVCSQDLFASSTKFESGCGWPAFSDVIDQGRVKLSKDTSHGKLDDILAFFFFFLLYSVVKFLGSILLIKTPS